MAVTWVWAGTTAVCQLTTYSVYGVLMDCDGLPEITITKEPIPISIIASGNFIDVGLGKYEYRFETEGKSMGEYAILVEGIVGGDQFVEKSMLEVR